MLSFPQLPETQRLQYLQAMGVSSWLPTTPLDGSANNGVLWVEAQSIPVSADMVSVGAEHSAAIPLENASKPYTETPTYAHLETTPTVDVEAQAQAVAQALGGLQADARVAPLEPVQAAVNETAMPTAASGPAASVAPMQLALSWYSCGVLVVNQVPLQEGAAMSSPIERLQTAIVNAILPSGGEPQQMPAASMAFNWPLVPGPHGDDSLEGAQSGLNYSIAKVLHEKPCKQLLLLGSAPLSLLKPDLGLGANFTLDLAAGPVMAVASHSLHQLLAVPSLKADTWSHLQPLLVHCQDKASAAGAGTATL